MSVDLAELPRVALKMLGRNDGGYDLMLLDPIDRQLRRLAIVCPGPRAFASAKALSAAHLAAHWIGDAIEELQPDGWNESGDQPDDVRWREAFEIWRLISA
jgi:hypothetical protein